MIKARVQATDGIEDLPITLTITATIKEWREIHRTMGIGYPHRLFGEVIANAIVHVMMATDKLVIEGEDVN